MNGDRTGVLPSQHLRRLISEGAIRAERPVSEAQIQPASLDLRLGRRAWRLRASFLPGAGLAGASAAAATVAARLPDFAMHEMDLTEGAVFERGCVYLCELAESLALPPDVSAAANAKSTSGRLDLFVRLIADGAAEFDRTPEGYAGPLFAEISPRSFSVLARSGARLNQIRLRRGDSRLTEAEAQALDPEGRGDARQGRAFSVDLRPAGSDVAGWRARRHTGLIDLEKTGGYAARDFWEPLPAESAGRLILDPGAFYILASRENLRTPPDCAAEMTPFSAGVGEFRVHYAGFFDPGFGCAEAGGEGARAVLEVRCHEIPFVLEHGQDMGRLVYERMLARPDKLYGAGGVGSHYQGQGLKLAKQFA
ncbi:2'-deoxycytidine 5'-triphosphate deaminase [Neomegalonema sp.]|uniref:2'-deoxycytidine 5'-triphosphate deaminase n=1 Tax=Neomegalonema sp. TaxID=2039713 RepID=UPI00261F6F35|nr:2'-deoxycytidine 5'-triphosphate deaminase [Neomegalonema sp.]MDD2869580.1 2'-deoxycytidine 5'-triphosphate deaminase [Neomegalonema sp.]